MKKYRVAYVVGIMMLALTNCAQMYVPQITGQVTDGITDGSLTMEQVKALLLFLVVVIMTIVVGRISWRFFLVTSSRKIERDIRSQLFGKWLRLDVTYFNGHKIGNLMAYATNDVKAIQMMTGMGIVTLFDAIILTAMVVYNMASYVDIRLTLVAILPMPIIAIGGVFFKKHIKIRFTAKQQAFAMLSDKVQESFAGIKVIKAFVQEDPNREGFEAQCDDNYQKNIALTKIQAFMQPFMTFLIGISLLISIGYGGYMTLINEITVGEFIAFNQYILMLKWPMSAITKAITIYAQGMASANRIEGVLDELEVIAQEAIEAPCEPLKGSITIRDLNFHFPDTDKPAIEGLSLEVEEGQTLAILGRTGSGKSTLVNMLLRQYNLEEEKLYIGGKDIMTLPVRQVRQTIAYVPQDNFLFSDTVANNIGFGCDEFELEAVIEAAKEANVHENIVQFTNQYDTLVGEKGTMLSGGQKQRIAIARALILDAPILILDDSLSAVDTRTEEAILANLKEVRQGKTNILIAHRISTVKNADKIIVMGEGRLVEEGNHETLLAKQGIYAQMYAQQKLEEAKKEQQGGGQYER